AARIYADDPTDLPRNLGKPEAPPFGKVPRGRRYGGLHSPRRELEDGLLRIGLQTTGAVPWFLTRAHEENLSHVLGVCGEIQQDRGEIRARNGVRTVGEVFASGFAPDETGRRAVRQPWRSNDGPVKPAVRDRPLHPCEV